MVSKEQNKKIKRKSLITHLYENLIVTQCSPTSILFLQLRYLRRKVPHARGSYRHTGLLRDAQYLVTTRCTSRLPLEVRRRCRDRTLTESRYTLKLLLQTFPISSKI